MPLHQPSNALGPAPLPPRLPHYCPICAFHEWNLDGLVEMAWEYLDLVRVYTKPKGEQQPARAWRPAARTRGHLLGSPQPPAAGVGVLVQRSRRVPLHAHSVHLLGQ